MNEPGTLLREAIALHQAGRLDEAARQYRRCLSREPALPPALFYAGMLALQRGRAAEAVDLLERLSGVDPERAEVWYQLAVARQRAGQPERAERDYRQALARRPGYAQAANNLGLLLRERGELAEARVWLETATTAEPGMADAWNNLGLVRHGQGELDAALACYQRALALDASAFQARLNLGSALADGGRFDEAIAILRAATALPGADAAKAWANLGAVLHEAGLAGQAASACETALRLDPSQRAARLNLARIEGERGDLEAARRHYGRALKQADEFGVRVRQALLLPPVPDSEAEIDAARAALPERLDALRRSRGRLRDPHREVGAPSFPIAYHGRADDRVLLEHLAGFYREVCPELVWEAPHCRAPASPLARRLRLGFVSAFFHEHSVGKAIGGLIAGLPRDRFELHVIRIPPFHDDARARRIEADATVHRLPDDLAGARERIAALELDLLCHADLGMDALAEALAHARLAPVQCATWGHPTTSGIATIDHYLSHAELEPEGSETLYSEHLVRIAGGAVFPGYPRPPLTAPAPTRAELGVPEHVPLLVCPQSLFKLMPVFDEPLAAILAGAPDACLLVPEERHPALTERLRARWSRVMPEAIGRVRFFSRRPLDAFVALIGAADLMLDPFPVGGGVTTFDAFATGIPIVTRPGRLMRGRFVQACYRRMGIDGPVAADAGEYVNLALALLADVDRHAALRARIQAASAALYDDQSALPEYADWFESAIRSRMDRPPATR